MAREQHAFGIEEETMLVDAVSLRPIDAEALHRRVRGHARIGRFVTREYLASQVEFSSPVHTTLADALSGLQTFRAAVVEACTELGGLPWNGGAPFDAPDGGPLVTRDSRYESITHGHGAVVEDHQINALHVHVGVPGRAEGVRVMNAVRCWMPVLLALGGDSPFWRGRDTGFASWRSILMRRWTTAGCPPAFADEDDYAERLARLVGVGGTADVATVAWNLRLSEVHPTIEFRVFDAQLAAWQSVLLAAVCRALVVQALDDPPRASAPDAELLDAALWHAARDGVTDRLMHPETGALEAAEVVVAALRRRIGPALREFGDEGFVDEGLERMLRCGTGAERQRSSFARAGVAGLRELSAASAVT